MPIAVITGGSQGFGRALASDLAKDGWGLVIDGRRADLVTETAQSLSGLGVSVWGVAGDVTDPEHRQALVVAAAELGGIDLLVNNASELGPSPLPQLAELRSDELRHIYEVNVISPHALVCAALPWLRLSGGTVVCLSSDAAVEAYPGWGGYGSSKSALDRITAVLAVEEPTLRVYGFDPGDMRTTMHQAAFPGEDISDRPQPEASVGPLRKLLASGAPSGRYRASEVS
jgi:NAD(P)-dependent dehydrogenase (short-subunit alcohol dehydrogenase family)